MDNYQKFSDNFQNLAIISKIVTDNSIASGGKYRETYRKRKKKIQRNLQKKKKIQRRHLQRKKKIQQNVQNKRYTEKFTAKRYRKM